MSRMLPRILFVALLVLATSQSSEARTWYVNEAGTGDAPTIPAAMDSAAYGDTVLVGPGTYSGQVYMDSGVVLRSEAGPTSTVLRDSPSQVVWFGEGVSGSLEGFTVTGGGGFERGAVACWGADDFAIRDNVMTGNWEAGITCDFCDGGEISGNTVVDNMGMGIWIQQMTFGVNVHNNVCVGNWWTGIQISESDLELECNNSWGNGDGDYDISFNWDPYSNFSEDPLFCDREAGDFTLDTCSPCLAGNHPYGYDCGLIGALGQGCDSPSSAESGTWGTIKALFR